MLDLNNLTAGQKVYHIWVVYRNEDTDMMSVGVYVHALHIKSVQKGDNGQKVYVLSNKTSVTDGDMVSPTSGNEVFIASLGNSLLDKIAVYNAKKALLVRHKHLLKCKVATVMAKIY